MFSVIKMPTKIKKHKTNVSCGLSGIKRIKKKLAFINKSREIDTIVNIPLNAKGLPDYDRTRVEERRMVREGYHTTWRLILQDQKKRTYLRLIIE